MRPGEGTDGTNRGSDATRDRRDSGTDERPARPAARAKAEGREPARVGVVAREPAACSGFGGRSAAPPVFFLPSPHDGRLPARPDVSSQRPRNRRGVSSCAEGGGSSGPGPGRHPPRV